jgi:3'5'-cyclic nucleotide phosphodiesterase
VPSSRSPSPHRERKTSPRTGSAGSTESAFETSRGVIICADSKFVRVVAGVMGELGFEPVVFGDPSSALRGLAAGGAAVVVASVGQAAAPAGPELTKAVAKTTPGVPIVMVERNEVSRSGDECLEAGAVEVLSFHDPPKLIRRRLQLVVAYSKSLGRAADLSRRLEGRTKHSLELEEELAKTKKRASVAERAEQSTSASLERARHELELSHDDKKKQTQVYQAASSELREAQRAAKTASRAHKTAEQKLAELREQNAALLTQLEASTARQRTLEQDFASLQDKLAVLAPPPSATGEEQTLEEQLAAARLELSEMEERNNELSLKYHAVLFRSLVAKSFKNPGSSAMSPGKEEEIIRDVTSLSAALKSPMSTLFDDLTALTEEKGTGSPVVARRALGHLTEIVRGYSGGALAPDVSSFVTAVAPGDPELAQFFATEYFPEQQRKSLASEVPVNLAAASSGDAAEHAGDEQSVVGVADPQDALHHPDFVAMPAESAEADEWTLDSSERSSKERFAQAIELDVIALSNEKLLEVVMALFVDSDLNLLVLLGVSADVLKNFIRAVADNYQSNPYHNFAHAVDVTWTVNAMLRYTACGDWLQPMDMLGLIVASLCHDVCHPGLNNAYQVTARTDLARIYSDKAVLENYHGASVLSAHSM